MKFPDARLATLAVPSLAVLVLLVVHSMRALPRARAIAFWISVVCYGILRGLAVRWVTTSLGARFPYEIHRPLFTIFRVSLQEIAGWAIVAYLAWWLGWSLSRRFAGSALFLQIAWGSLFLGCVSWTTEAAAVASGWWHWTVPTASRYFLNVPPIGLIDWFFVGSDFLLPFVALTSPSPRLKSWRYLSLLLFPLHFGAHGYTHPISPSIPIPWFHLVHWLLLATLVVLAVRSDAVDDGFAELAGATRLFPIIGVSVIALDAIAVLLFVVHKPLLIAATGPLIALTVASLTQRGAVAVPAAAIVAALAHTSFGLTALPHLARATLLWLRDHRRALTVVLIAMGALAWTGHSRSARRQIELQERLDHALAERNGGHLGTAVDELQGITRDYPTTHVPFAFLAEIYYRTGRLSEALPLYEQSTEIMQDFLMGYRYGAAIALREGDPTRAAAIAQRGLTVSANDLELLYLDRRARGGSMEEIIATAAAEAGTSRKLAGLAFEVGDTATARQILDASLALHPQVRALYPMRVRIALAEGRKDEADKWLRQWSARFPDDPELKRIAPSS